MQKYLVRIKLQLAKLSVLFALLLPMAAYASSQTAGGSSGRMKCCEMPSMMMDRASPRIAWQVNVHEPIYNIPRVSGGTAYFDTAQAAGFNVFAVRKGRVIWKYATDGAIGMPVTIGGVLTPAHRGPAQVFVASDVGNIHHMRAIDARNGRLVWDYTRDEPPECMCSNVTHFMKHLLFAETDGHSLYAFSPFANIPNHRIWAFQGDGAKLTAPVTVAGLVVFGSADHCVYGLDGRTGKVIWKATTGYTFEAQPAVWHGAVILGNTGGTVHALSAKTGQSLWSFSTNGPITTRAVVWKNNVYVASGPGDRGVYDISANNGNQIWYRQFSDYTPYAPILDDSVLVVASRDGNIVGLSPSSGKVLWKTALHGMPESQPIAWNSDVALKVNDHRITVVSAKSGRALWTYHSRSVLTPPVARGQRLYFGQSNGKLVAVKF
ncbi:MAG: PQQ-binding-like beta-propeller repeat protein [Phycisphaerae bacterium]